MTVAPSTLSFWYFFYRGYRALFEKNSPCCKTQNTQKHHEIKQAKGKGLLKKFYLPALPATYSQVQWHIFWRRACAQRTSNHYDITITLAYPPQSAPRGYAEVTPVVGRSSARGGPAVRRERDPRTRQPPPVWAIREGPAAAPPPGTSSIANAPRAGGFPQGETPSN
jgi:hypothetical protein